jgi:hypothetical protein
MTRMDSVRGTKETDVHTFAHMRSAAGLTLQQLATGREWMSTQQTNADLHDRVHFGVLPTH